MNNVKLESKKIVKARKSRNIAGVQVRSGIKVGTRTTRGGFENPETLY